MESRFINELFKINAFSTQLTTILQKISKQLSSIHQSLHHKKQINQFMPASANVRQLEHHLVSLCCQNKNLLHYRYLQNKMNNQHCLAYIVEILAYTVKIYQSSASNVVNLFLGHILSHTSCYISYYTFFMLIQMNKQILGQVTYQKLSQVNMKLQKQMNVHQNIKMLHSIQLNKHEIFSKQHLQICDRNLNTFLQNKFKPNDQKIGEKQKKLYIQKKNNQQLTSIKIPPLSLPTSKTINSQRFSAISKDDKRKGLFDFYKLAGNLGEDFITVELGCLLSNNRTKQVQQFSQNQTFRQKCLEKIERIETQRMNSSRITLMLSGNTSNGHLNSQNTHTQIQEVEESSKRYYRKVLAVNLNILYRKIILQKKQLNFFQYLKRQIRLLLSSSNHKRTSFDSQNKQTYFTPLITTISTIIDMSIAGSIDLTQKFTNREQSFLSQQDKFQGPSVFSLIMKKMKPIQKTIEQLMILVSRQSTKIHQFLLSNQNKKDCIYHFQFGKAWEQSKNCQQAEMLEQSVADCQIYSDQLLQNLTIRVNQPAPIKGSYKLFSDKKQKDIEFLNNLKRYSDPVLLYLGGHLQSLQQSADMNHPLFYFYQTNALKNINFYLKSTWRNNQISTFYIAQFMTPLLIMLKRQLLELSHPYFQEFSSEYSNFNNSQISAKNTKKALKNMNSLNLHEKSPNKVDKPLIFAQPQLMGQYVLLITNMLQVNTPHSDQIRHHSQIKRNKYIQKLISNIFIKNINFMELLEHFVDYVFEQQKLPEIQIVLNFYQKAMQVYVSSSSAQMASKSKNNTSQLTKNARILYQHLGGYLQPKTGCVSKFLNQYQYLISPSKLEIPRDLDFNSNLQLNTDNHKIKNILHCVLVFIARVYYISSPENSQSQTILEQQIASFYIKYSIMGFIKLYSLLTVTELVNINSDNINDLKNRNMSIHGYNMDHVLSTKQSPHLLSQVNTKQIFMIDFLKILTSLSTNRTPSISKKFRQHRVLQFFARQIQLQFSVSQNIQKYLKQSLNISEVLQYMQMHQNGSNYEEKQENSQQSHQQKQYSQQHNIQQVEQSKIVFSQNKKQQKSKNQKPKKFQIPNLNLTGKLFKKSQSYKEQQIVSNSKDQSKGLSNIQQPFPMKKVPPLFMSNQQDSLAGTKKVGLKQDIFLTKQKPKGYLDDILQKIVKPKKKSKRGNSLRDKKKSSQSQNPDLKTEEKMEMSMNMNINLNLNLGNLRRRQQTSQRNDTDDNMNSQQMLTEKSTKVVEKYLIYQTQRKIRKIYSNKILHSESILLILSLILYKGQLDSHYCDQMPIINGKINVLYILHYHLNHQSNKTILPILAESVNKIKPYLAGQRLLKLLSNNCTDLSNYHSWSKINAGAFGVVMTAQTNIQDPKQVAIKQMNFPKSIYERCVLHDIFTEITCLQMFRLEQRIAKMYNYGVKDNTYVIIMKKYQCSVRDWRLGNVENQQINNFAPTLPHILELFYEILKGVKMLHDHNITHYDIKCDNILLELQTGQDPRQPPQPKGIFADFGVSKIYVNEKDQLDLKSRGTECIKSPQMLTLTLKNKKQADNYDRRKKIGTTKASDIWSLGCLLYELVTGQFLFNSNDWVHFFLQVTTPKQQILNQAQCQKMNNNIYLIDFMKYIMIRDPQHRPSIYNIITRFQNLYALLVSNPQRFASNDLRLHSKNNFQQLLIKYQQQIQVDTENSDNFEENINLQKNGSIKKQRSKKQTDSINKKHKTQNIEHVLNKTQKIVSVLGSKNADKMIKIMEDIYFSGNKSYLVNHEQKLSEEGITHIIIMSGDTISNIDRNKFKVLEICWKKGQVVTDNIIYRLCPKISDYLREVLLLKGKLLFINDQANYTINLVIFVLSYWFRCSVYETWCLINTQILLFPTFTSSPSLKKMSKMLNILKQIEQEVQGFPKLQCICGSVTIILKKKFQQKKGQLRPCICSKKKQQKSSCFSRNCNKYLQFIKKRYNIAWDGLTWALVHSVDLLTPLDPDSLDHSDMVHSNLILNSSHPIDNMIWQQQTPEGYKIGSCRICQMWILSSFSPVKSDSINDSCQSPANKNENWVILNNLIKSYRQGIMIPNAQQQFMTRTPALNYFTLSKLHMTSQQ